MIREANQRAVLMINTAALATDATATATVDVRGFDFAQISVFKQRSAALTSLKIEHGDVDTGTYVTTGINLTSGTDFTLTTQGTSALTVAGTNPYYQFNIDTRGLRRYLKVSVTPGTATQDVVVFANLGRRQIGGPTASSSDARSLTEV